MLDAKLRRAGLSPDEVPCVIADESAVAALNEMPSLNVIVTLDDAALALAAGKTSTYKWHLSPLDAIPELTCRKVIPTFSPQTQLRQYDLGIYMDLALKRAREESETRLYDRKPKRFLLNPDLAETFEVLERLRTADTLSIDIETGRGQINTVGFAWSPSDAIAINVLPDRLSPENYYRLWRLLAELIEGPSRKVCQNGIYETLYFARYGIRLRNLWHDTMVAQKLLWPELDKDLGTVGRIYTREPYWKDSGRVATEEGGRRDWANVRDWDAHYTYNCSDTSGTLEAALAQRADLSARGLAPFFYDYLMPQHECLAEMCLRGLPLDLEEQSRLVAEYEAKCADLVAGLSRPLNPKSWQQKLKLFREKGYKLPKKRNKAKDIFQESSDELSLKKLRLAHPEDTDIQRLLDYAKLSKALSSYLRVVPDPLDSQVRFSLGLNSTETGRWCLRKDTAVSVPGGTKPIQDIASGDLVYCYDNNRNLQLSRVTWSGRTGHKSLVRIHWRTNNGSVGQLDCTPEHRIRLLNGTYVCAAALKPKTQTLALSRMHDAGYVKLWHFGKKSREHCFVFENIYGWKPEVVHHRDGNKLNNAPANLDGMTISDHVREHALADLRKPGQPSASQRARGSRSGRAKLTEDQVREIKVLLAQGYSANNIAPSFNVKRATIIAIQSGRNWKHVTLNNHIIDHVETLDTADDVYDLEVEHWHNFIANEICVHNSGYVDPWDRGLNPQTLPKYSKKMIRFSSERIFLQVDLRQAESRFVAYDSCDTNLIGALTDPSRDIHSEVAAEIFGCPVAQVRAEHKAGNSAKRQLGKKSGHGANYSMGAATFQNSCLKELDLVLTKDEAGRTLNAYHTLFPGITRWHARIRETLRRERRLTNPLGRVRYFYGRMDDNTFRESYAYRPQSTVPDIISHLMLRLAAARADGDLSFWFHLQAHDSLTLSCVPGKEHDIAEFCFKTEGWHPEVILPAGRLIIPTSVEVGSCMGKLEEYERR